MTTTATLRLGQDYSNLDWSDKEDAQARDLLTDTDREDIKERVRKDNQYGDKSKLASQIQAGIRSAASSGADFIQYGDDVRWLLLGLFYATDQSLDINATEKIPGTEGQGVWGRGSRHRTLTRQDVVDKVALLNAEQREEVGHAREDIATNGPSTQELAWCGTIEECDRAERELAETLWFAQRWLDYATPYRLGRLAKDIEEHLADDVRDSLFGMVSGEDSGSSIRETAERHFNDYMVKWMKEAQTEFDTL